MLCFSGVHMRHCLGPEFHRLVAAFIRPLRPSNLRGARHQSCPHPTHRELEGGVWIERWDPMDGAKNGPSLSPVSSATSALPGYFCILTSRTGTMAWREPQAAPNLLPSPFLRTKAPLTCSLKTPGSEKVLGSLSSAQLQTSLWQRLLPACPEPLMEQTLSVLLHVDKTPPALWGSGMEHRAGPESLNIY